MSFNIAVIGANTLIGHEIITILHDTQFPVKKLTPLSTKKESGKPISFGDIDIITLDIAQFDFKGTDYIFYAGDRINARDSLSHAIKDNIKIIDLSGETFFDEAKENLKSLPCASTSIIVKTLKPFLKNSSIKRIVLTALESTSGEGKDGMDELFNQSRKFFISNDMPSHVFAKQIMFNIIPQVDEFMSDGQTQSEWRITSELKKILGKDVKITTTCIQVPVFIGHSFTVNVEFNDVMDTKTAKSLWTETKGITVIDEKSDMQFITPSEIAGEDAVFISRLRQDNSQQNTLSYWCTSDNVRVNALKAVSLAKKDLAV